MLHDSQRQHKTHLRARDFVPRDFVVSFFSLMRCQHSNGLVAARRQQVRLTRIPAEVHHRLVVPGDGVRWPPNIGALAAAAAEGPHEEGARERVRDHRAAFGSERAAIEALGANVCLANANLGRKNMCACMRECRGGKLPCLLRFSDKQRSD